jgi:hypothetical protein
MKVLAAALLLTLVGNADAAEMSLERRAEVQAWEDAADQLTSSFYNGNKLLQEAPRFYPMLPASASEACWRGGTGVANWRRWG